MNIQLEDVSFAVPGRPILKGITTSIAGDTFTCLLGPNGSGKTTLLRLLTGQLKATRGRIVVAGVDASTLSQREMARRFAILPQGIQDPPHLTVRELVALGRFHPGKGWGWRLDEPDRAAVAAAILQCGVGHLAERTFAGLSGGEKQRAWLAFCLAQEKGFLLLDESLASLDYAAKRAFFQFLATLTAKGRGVLLATHDLELASQFATKLLVIDGGAVVYDGPRRPDLPALLTAGRGTVAGD